MTNRPSRPTSRRSFLREGSLLLAGTAILDPASLFGADDPPALRIGLVTDLHYADKPPAGTRHYRETPTKLAEAAERFGQSNLDFVVELGDLIDAADTVETELAYLKTINQAFSAIAKDRHYVLGNHCVDTLTKDEFLGEVGQARSYYSFDRGAFHFVVLDACFRQDGVPYGRKNAKWTDTRLPAEELEWLEEDLRSTERRTVIFAHQRLDVADAHGVKNSPDVRKVLEESQKVLAVFQGHSHKNDLKEIGGIPYCTLVAMIEGSGPENNGFSLMEIAGGGAIRLTGFRNQKSHVWQ